MTKTADQVKVGDTIVTRGWHGDERKVLSIQKFGLTYGATENDYCFLLEDRTVVWALSSQEIEVLDA